MTASHNARDIHLKKNPGVFAKEAGKTEDQAAVATCNYRYTVNLICIQQEAKI
jgi:hypothetical protein